VAAGWISVQFSINQNDSGSQAFVSYWQSTPAKATRQSHCLFVELTLVHDPPLSRGSSIHDVTDPCADDMISHL
jgi:hypothetical protein